MSLTATHPVAASYQFERADVILALDSDFLLTLPGSIPCAIASPRNAMPLMTTHVPTTAQMAAHSEPPMRARSMKSVEKGSRNRVTLPP